MEIEYGMAVVDKNDKTIGVVGKIFMDTWTAKPRKYMVTRVVLHAPDEIYMIPPEQVAEVSAGKVKLTVTVEELGEKSG
jgi:hypothetical protein